jgi:DNA-binding transcriptional regulator YhcF (GntR family)
MAREQVAGSIILDRLRDRIVSGLYVGYWRSGDRLPSIREIAEAEHVDRKTAAAAYRRLETEGLVRVRPRSGIYLSGPSFPDASGPLDRLYRRWLEHTYDGARALGLDTRTIQRLVSAVAELQRVRVPVIERDWSQAEAIAVELRERLELRTVACSLDDVKASDPLIADAPVVVTTPHHLTQVAPVAGDRPVIDATMSPEMIRELRDLAAAGGLAIVTGSALTADKIKRTLTHCGISTDSILDIVAVVRPAEAAAMSARCVFIWPGAPAWIDDALPRSTRAVRPARSVSDESLARIQAAVLDAAIRRVKDQMRAEDAAADGARGTVRTPVQ